MEEVPYDNPFLTILLPSSASGNHYPIIRVYSSDKKLFFILRVGAEYILHILGRINCPVELEERLYVRNVCAEIGELWKAMKGR